MKIRVLSRQDVDTAVCMAQAIRTVKEAFVQLSQGNTDVPLRIPLEVKKRDGVTLFMPAYLQETDQMGIKIVSVFYQNLDKGLPTINALVVLVDTETGCPSAVMDGTYLTALRTGAVSGAATELLARADARTVAILGTGVQGRTQLEAVCVARSIEQVFLYDPHENVVAKFYAEMLKRGAPVPKNIVICKTAEAAVAEADVICTSTTAREPVFLDASLKSGTHVNAIGSYTPDMQEIPSETMRRARVFADSTEACWAETGDLIIPRENGFIASDHVQAELGELASGMKSGRENTEEITLFKSVGNAIQDVAVGSLVLQEAERQGLGTEMDL